MPNARRWTPAEDAALADWYPSVGQVWPGWADLLPGRTPNAIACRAWKLGVTGKTGRPARGAPKPGPARPARRGGNAAPPSLRPETCGGCRFYAGDPEGAGECVEYRARRWFGEHVQVLACYDASLCDRAAIVTREREDTDG